MTSLARHGHPENPKPAARHDSKRLVDNDVTIIDGDVIITDSDVIIRPDSRCLVVPNYCKNTERRHDCWRRLCRDIYQIESWQIDTMVCVWNLGSVCMQPGFFNDYV